MTHWGTVSDGSSAPAAMSEPLHLEVSSLPQVPDSGKITEGIRGLYQKCQMYDLNLVVGKSRFPAHKAVLAAMSQTCCERLKQAAAEQEMQRQSAVTAAAAAAAAASAAATATPPATATSSEAPAPSASGGVETVASQNDEAAAAGAAGATVGVQDIQLKLMAELCVPGTATRSLAVAPSDPATPVVAPPSNGRLDLHLTYITRPEAVQALLDFVYGLSDKYTVECQQVNKEVLRLAQELDIGPLQELATEKLVEDVHTQNVVERLATCKEFGLEEAYGAIQEEIVKSKPALQAIAEGTEVLQAPTILQTILVRAAEVHRPIEESSLRPGKRSAEESKGGKEKQAKASAKCAGAGGA
eukprot:TRINITY_DN9328_c2_g1_i1.p1 TRINITY_DN9328_c2_g1~~TRINITY_DN9328_c2_g1_i1.p1  ORF type:complete len:357 (+),score=102.80 TRINITY_DN9328_c2_g1_i1:73-1143(+)